MKVALPRRAERDLARLKSAGCDPGPGQATAAYRRRHKAPARLPFRAASRPPTAKTDRRTEFIIGMQRRAFDRASAVARARLRRRTEDFGTVH
jgi:hypothetical protein